jgi:hypothetical protein
MHQTVLLTSPVSYAIMVKADAVNAVPTKGISSRPLQ